MGTYCHECGEKLNDYQTLGGCKKHGKITKNGVKMSDVEIDGYSNSRWFYFIDPTPEFVREIFEIFKEGNFGGMSLKHKTTHTPLSIEENINNYNIIELMKKMGTKFEKYDKISDEGCLIYCSLCFDGLTNRSTFNECQEEFYVKIDGNFIKSDKQLFEKNEPKIYHCPVCRE